IDKQGYVWFCRIGADMLGRLDPKTGQIDDLRTGPGSAPRRMAVGPDGTLWVTAYGNGKLIKVDPRERKVIKEYAMPAGGSAGPYAVTVDGAGRVWANEIDTDTVALFDPGAENFVSSSCRPAASASARPLSTPRAATGTWAVTTGV
ncbi:MAG TPA: hypothetical protein VJS66_02560, partial [Burkholderiales bacterium]|nr:hypothetical protein [Burkholderiales bacterium]